MDADGQHLPEENPKVILPLQNKIAHVVGSHIKGILRTSPINKIGNLFLKIISFMVQDNGSAILKRFLEQL